MNFREPFLLICWDLIVKLVRLYKKDCGETFGGINLAG